MTCAIYGRPFFRMALGNETIEFYSFLFFKTLLYLGLVLKQCFKYYIFVLLLNYTFA